jgi:uncharacterized Zn-finger protein
MKPFETIVVDSTVVACNGGGGPLGHPRVYLNLGPDHRIECPYCSRLFVLRGTTEPGHAAETPPSATSAARPAPPSAKP